MVFDPARIADVATYDSPHQYATGVSTVVVNGEVVIDGGEHTGAAGADDPAARAALTAEDDS
ncbi:MAG: hypothetical protein IPJ28_15580 [Betaproteobacteria bacterium]|nr:hypothetical protein [Betaproteobacteria bacterium]